MSAHEQCPNDADRKSMHEINVRSIMGVCTLLSQIRTGYRSGSVIVCNGDVENGDDEDGMEMDDHYMNFTYRGESCCDLRLLIPAS